MKPSLSIPVISLIFFSMVCHAAPISPTDAPSLTVEVYRVSDKGVGDKIGTVIIRKLGKKEGTLGVELIPDLRFLSSGYHGFHIHENPSCEAGKKDGKSIPALAAGGHYDPDKTGRHEGPYGQGHKGDLPRLLVDEKGVANTAIIAPRLTLKELSGRSLMIHAGADNFRDEPPMGGGGARIACGVIKLGWNDFN